MTICTMNPPMKTKPIVIRVVNAGNLKQEMTIIRGLMDRFRIVAMDTEFPGVVVRQADGDPQGRFPAANYFLVKQNVDRLYLIQIGITISDDEGNLPDLGTEFCYIWEFNFKEFDAGKHEHDSNSIQLLKRQGINFERNHEIGIDVVQFAELVMSSGLVCNEDVSWVTFHGAYDFGYLVKILTMEKLPHDLTAFLALLRVLCGDKVYDVKHMIKYCATLHGGLDRVAKALGVNRVVGKGHQAGSDSLLTMQAYQKIKGTDICQNGIGEYAGKLYGRREEKMTERWTCPECTVTKFTGGS